MILTQAKATFGLTAQATPLSPGASGKIILGKANESIALDTAVAYSIRAIFAGSGDVLAIFFGDGHSTGSTAWVAGVAQVTTATAAGSVSAPGNASVTLTAAGMSGSPKTLAVAVAASDTPTLWAAKVRAALTADPVIGARFTVGGVGAAIVVTRKPTSTFAVPEGTLGLYAANDATLNLALATGTATGITAAPTSAATTAGVISDGVKIYGADEDFEGNPIFLESVSGFYLHVEAGQLNNTGSPLSFILNAGDRFLFTGIGNGAFPNAATLTAAMPSAVNITVM